MKNEQENLKTGEQHNKSMVGIRNGFSERNGLCVFNAAIQVLDFDRRTRTSIYNLLFDTLTHFSQNRLIYFKNDSLANNFDEVVYRMFYIDILGGFSDDIIKFSDWKTLFREHIRKIILNAPYNEVLDVVEYICNFIEKNLIQKYTGIVHNHFNKLYEKENVGYRFVNDFISPITNEAEIYEIHSALKNPLDNCRIQIEKALKLFSDRDNKDYKNCIKEAISAVEALCKNIPGKESSTLKEAVNSFEKNGIIIHPVLKGAILKLFAYASDEGGLRHGEKPEISNVSSEEAKFILILCSSIINYLTSVFKDSKII